MCIRDRLRSLAHVQQVETRWAAPGYYTICGADALAYVLVEATSCAFAPGPCASAACQDPTSTECKEVAAEYCATYADEACQEMALVFTRKVGETATLSLPGSGENVRFASPVCGG